MGKKCPHGRQKYYCADCGGAGFCEHGVMRKRCKPCGGSSLCVHGSQRAVCKPCGGSQICEHKHQRSQCKDCGGSQICRHGNHRPYCKSCGGSQICKHGIDRRYCKPCGGSRFCRHDRQRHQCSVCRPKSVYKSYQHKAKLRRASFALTVEQFISIVVLPCHYCDEATEPRGVDRWDNNIGYEFENCRPCCATCNFGKRDMDGPTFVEWARRVANHTQAIEESDFQ